MKKVLLSIVLIIISTASYLLYDEHSFSPLNKGDIQKLFKGNNISYEKYCSKDFLGLSTHGELFEIYQYKIKKGVIVEDFSKIVEWEKVKIKDGTIVKNWTFCPPDTHSTEFFSFTLAANNLDKVNCSSSFYEELLESNNYYSYIYFNELEHYFLLYSPNKDRLYYIRRRGF